MVTHRRSRGGCSQCRGVSRKCDEAKPTCGRCKRLQFDCRYAARFTWKDEGRKFEVETGGGESTAPAGEAGSSRRAYASSTSTQPSLVATAAAPNDEAVQRRQSVVSPVADTPAYIRRESSNPYNTASPESVISTGSLPSSYDDDSLLEHCEIALPPVTCWIAERADPSMRTTVITSGHNGLHWSDVLEDDPVERITRHFYRTCPAQREAIIAYELLEVDAPVSMALSRVESALQLFSALLASEEGSDKELVLVTGYLICHIAVRRAEEHSRAIRNNQDSPLTTWRR
jgi:hypothetical protein